MFWWLFEGGKVTIADYRPAGPVGFAYAIQAVGPLPYCMGATPGNVALQR